MAEGDGPDQAGQTEKPGTADDSSTVEVTAPQEPDTAAPAEIAEGEESPAEAATSASLSTGAQVGTCCLFIAEVDCNASLSTGPQVGTCCLLL